MLWEFDRRRLLEDLERWYEEELIDPDSYDESRFEAHFGENEGASRRRSRSRRAA